MKKIAKLKTPYEFVLKINENIICQRYFNVRNYNEKFRESLEVIEMTDEIMGVNNYLELGIIPEFFKKQCMAKLWGSYNPSYYQTRVRKRDNLENEYYFNLQVLINKEVVADTSFSAALFHYTIRYNIDIREIIPTIVNVITNYMSLDNYTEKFGGVLLNRHNKYEQR